MSDSWDEVLDWERWAKEVLTDWRVPFDDHKVGLRLGITQLLCDKRDEADALRSRLSAVEAERDIRLAQVETHVQANVRLEARLAEMTASRDAAVSVEALTAERARRAEARLAEADKANQLLRADIAAQSREEDLILMALRLDPERYRTECGYLNVPKIIAAIKNPDMYPRTSDSTSEVKP